jgi:imidazoleglycerol-phosphate dehydratase
MEVMREAEVERKTNETKISVRLNLDGHGKVESTIGVGFIDHMMRTLGVHSGIDLKIEGKGDLRHHVIEDVGICLGETMRKALGNCSGINRFGYAIVPMDDALAIAAVDLVSRPYGKINLALGLGHLEDASGEDVLHFLETFVTSLRATIHINVQYGINDHHKVEAAIKALALSLRQAITISPMSKGVPSAKGSI